MKKTKRFLLLIAMLSAITLTACGGGGGDGGGSTPSTQGTTRTYYGSQVPGDVWTWTIGASTFNATNYTNGYYYSGSKETLASGFLKLTIPDAASTTDPGIITFPAVAYALEFPNTVLLVKPAGGSDNLIAAVALGACPTTTENYNWVEIPRSGWNAANDGAYGTATFTPPGASYTITGNKYYLNGIYMVALNATATCAGGQFTITSGGRGTGAITPSRAFVADDGVNNGGGFGMIAPASNVDLAAVASKNYRGIVFKKRGPVDETEPVGARPGTGVDAGKLIGYCYTDVEVNIECPSTDNAILDLTTAAQAIPGIVNVQITDTEGVHDAVMMINIVNGKYMLFGISTNTTSAEPYNFMLIEQ